MTLPTDPAARKALPLCTGVLDYFPDALAEVAACSKAGNDQHNPGEPLYWARAKSGDEADALVRHLMQRGTLDSDGIRHSAKVAWRALALLQRELEADGAPLARGAREGKGKGDGADCGYTYTRSYPFGFVPGDVHQTFVLNPISQADEE